MSEEEINKNKREGYKEALLDIIGGKTPSEIYANLTLNDAKIEKVGRDWAKVLPLWTGLILTLSAVFFGYTQCQQKDKELELTKINSLGDLVDKLSSDKQSERKYATFAALSLGIGGFEKLVVTSISDTDTDAFNNIETLELLLEKIKTDDLKLIVQKKLSKIYTKNAEDSATSSPNSSESYANTAIKNFPNAIAQYRLGRFEQAKNLDEALKDYEVALKDLENGQSDFVLDLRKDIKISIYERMGQTADTVNNPKAREYYKSAYDLLNPSEYIDTEDDTRRKILEGCIKSKEECKFQ